MIEKNRKEKGKYGEELASTYLLQAGHVIIARNIHSRFGQIDIMSIKEQTIHIIEVKSRYIYDKHTEKASYSMSSLKKSRMRKTFYSTAVQKKLSGISYKKIQYDFVAIDVLNGNVQMRLYWNIS